MHRYLFTFFLTAAFLFSACSGQSPSVEITPSQCNLRPGEKITFSIKGVIGSNPTISWSASDGLIQAQDKDGLLAIFTAPLTPGLVTITVTVTSNLTPVGPLSTTCVIQADNPTATDPQPTPTVFVLPSNPYSVAISEVMANPCGNDDFKKWNEYVELYNYGDAPVDVGGWRLTDSGPDTRPDELIAWDSRSFITPLGNGLVTNSTVIPAHGFALVLSPIYTDGVAPYHAPYSLPPGTVILTIKDGDRLGDDTYGIIGYGGRLDVVVLYVGGANSIQQVISTYGTPELGKYPQDIHDNRADNIPLDLRDCSSAERVNPLMGDIFENWKEVFGGSPGEAPYQ